MKLIAGLGLVAAVGALAWSIPGCGSSPPSTGSSGGGGATASTTTADGGQGGDTPCAASELCNGIDDNCNDEVDEGCACIEGDTQSCSSGDGSVEGIGVCQAGQQSCNNLGEWGSCEGEVLPSAEICDGQDNDCNGSTDEGFGQVTCGLGTCQVTVDECVDGVPNPCTPSAPNPVENCDGFDDDCDGAIDNGCDCQDGATQSCYGGPLNTQGVGLCVAGTQSCTGGQWQACQGDVLPTTEVCNGFDDDCDSIPDDNDPGGGVSCQADAFGICKDGITSCVSGFLDCIAGTPLPAEVCNGFDDDCNDETDEGNPGGGAACSTGNPGICDAGTETCINSGIHCVQDNVAAASDICANGLDDDCDMATDEDCCAHDKCTIGAALTSGCDPCVTQVCAADAYCCSGAWDSLCKQQVFTVCGLTDCGTCTMPLNPSVECGANHHCEPDASGIGLCIDPVGSGVQSSACLSGADCAADYSCIDAGGLPPACLQWCQIGGTSCGALTCTPLSTPVFIGAQQWGVCF